MLPSPISAFYSIRRRFCANPLNLSNFHLHVKHDRFSPQGRSNSMLAEGSSDAIFDRPERERSHSETSRSAKYQRATSKTRPSLWGSRELNSRVLQWLVLCGIPYRGSGALASPDPTNQLPTSLIGQAKRPPGGSTAHLQLPKSSTRHSRLQIRLSFNTR